MRKSAIDALLPGTRKAILAATLMQPERWWYLSDLAHHLAVSPSSLQRELASLVEAGILRRKRDGNRVYYQPDPDCPFLPELTGLMTKTAGLLDVLRKALGPFGGSIRWAFVYGSVARAEERSSSDVDLMMIGRVGLAELAPTLRKAERILGRPVNPTVYTPEEFAQKREAGHHFIKTVLREEKLTIMGDGDDLATTSGKPPDSQPRDKPSRAERPKGRH
jgi:DNA-binding transcriptional ArsR family regulator